MNKTEYNAYKATRLPLGFYTHWKTGEVYEVTNFVKDCNNNPDHGFSGWEVIYRNVKTRKEYSRDAVEFVEVIGPNGQKRFTLTDTLDTPLQLFITTLRMNRLDYLRAAQENPLFIQNQIGKSFKYVLGDKIAFARSIRMINTTTANLLLKWVQNWTAEPSTSNEYEGVFLRNLDPEDREHFATLDEAGRKEFLKGHKP